MRRTISATASEGDQMWSFTSALFLLQLFPDSMLLPAIHGFITGLCVIMFGALIGEWVDRTPRLPAVRIALITQRSCVALGSLILTFTFLFKESISDSGKFGCVFGFMLFAIVGDCASVAMNIIVKKDWVVVIAGGSKTDLADMNVTIRRIDLTCQILSPIIIAQILTFGAHYVGTIVVSVWNVLSVVAEYFILQTIYEQRPQLAVKTSKRASSDQRSQTKRPLHRQIFRSCFAIRDGWQTYFKNRVAPAGIGLAFLYMTVLSFNGVTNTYILTQGLSESVISIMMAVGAVTGIAGTFVFPVLRQKIGLERTGFFALAFQLAFLCLCVLSVWLPGTPFHPDFVRETQNETMIELMKEDRNSTQIDSGKWITQPAEKLPSAFVFLAGMIGARFGLWMADLTITQLIQENISEKERGVIGGVQSSLNGFMDMLKFILVIFLPYPETFGILIIISFLFVIFGDGFYALYSYRTRGHLLPHCGPTPDQVDERPNSVLSRRELLNGE
ncbi:Solute carrier family 40 member 1 [Hypsibius exemplaris]|uniref:Solute carrier family 40 member n=1 Tax=Hypsibius exemplaris TaxID=2072580 RepID=A0A1W0WMJ0_HYPEX|nr:Solute carrier family 40 member 1 [Hypsibius exemplaris]